MYHYPINELVNKYEFIEKLNVLKGTTTVGIVANEGVVLAADKRAVAGYYIAHKRVKKILKVDEKVMITTAGLVADAQALVNMVKNEIKYYKLTSNVEVVNVRTIASILSNILHAYKWYPFIVQLLVGGYDTKPRLFMLEVFGAISEEKYAATGSGSPIAIGIIEENYREDMSIEEAVELAIKAVKSAIRRDTATGEGVDIAIITSKGVVEKTVK